jgi:hypothetical protein
LELESLANRAAVLVDADLLALDHEFIAHA